MHADDALDAAPRAFSGQRLGWLDLPRSVRTRIGELAGAPVTAEIGATSGFSPGFASVLELADGHAVFAKAVSPEQNPDSPTLARAEIRAAAALPDVVPAPRLVWADEHEDWVLAGWEVAHGRSPELPWRPVDLAQVLDVVAVLASAVPLPGHGLPTAAESLGPTFTGWRSWRELPATLPGHGSAPGLAQHDAWVEAHLDELAGWEAHAEAAMVGDVVVHADLRADNVLLDGRRTWLVDWPHACVGAPWVDLACMLPSVAMQGGGNPQEHFWTHAVAADAAIDDVRAVVAGVAGYFAAGARRPAPPGIPNLRVFQRAQALTALAWLRDLA